MAQAQEALDFSGPYKDELEALAEVINWLWAEHDKSFVEAGDDKVYAFGGGGYVLVLDDHRWSGLIELITPGGALQFKRGDDGKTAVLSANEDQSAIKAIIKDGAAGIRRYYENRYWTTPLTSASQK